MDTHKETLDMMLRSLKENNDLLGWNICPTKRGRILLKIEFGGVKEETIDTQNHVSYRKKTLKETERNHHRAKNYQENILPAKRKRHESTTEISRKPQNSPISTPAHLSPDPVQCFEKSSVDRKISTDSKESECFDDSLFTPDAARESTPECVAVKPDYDSHQSPVMPELSKTHSFQKDQTAHDKPDLTSDRENDGLHTCKLENEARHSGECGPKHFLCVVARRSLYLDKWDMRAQQNPKLQPLLEDRKSAIKRRFKLEDCIDIPPDLL